MAGLHVTIQDKGAAYAGHVFLEGNRVSISVGPYRGGALWRKREIEQLIPALELALTYMKDE